MDSAARCAPLAASLLAAAPVAWIVTAERMGGMDVAAGGEP